MTAVVGETVTLPCRTTTVIATADWYFVSSEKGRPSIVSVAGKLVNGYSNRFTIETNVQGDFSLTIRSATRADAGMYICRWIAGEDLEHRMMLNVHGKISIAVT